MRMNTMLILLIALGCLLPGAGLAQAPADTTRFVCILPVEPMPELVSGGGNKGIIKAIRRRFIYPPEGRMMCVEGRLFIAFTITPAGEVKQAQVVKSLGAPFDSAAVQAVRQLPCFKPRLPRHGDIRYVVPFSIREADEARAPVRRRKPTR
jgi:TonB family protein